MSRRRGSAPDTRAAIVRRANAANRAVTFWRPVEDGRWLRWYEKADSKRAQKQQPMTWRDVLALPGEHVFQFRVDHEGNNHE